MSSVRYSCTHARRHSHTPSFLSRIILLGQTVSELNGLELHVMSSRSRFGQWPDVYDNMIRRLGGGGGQHPTETTHCSQERTIYERTFLPVKSYLCMSAVLQPPVPAPHWTQLDGQKEATNQFDTSTAI